MSDHRITNVEKDVINTLSQAVHNYCDEAGWWDQLNDVLNHLPGDFHHMVTTWFLASKIALVHSEVSEALEALRKGLRDDHLPHRNGVEVEMADAMIRIFDMMGFMRMDLGGAVQEKFKYNQQRADHKLDARGEPGGKTI